MPALRPPTAALRILTNVTLLLLLGSVTGFAQKPEVVVQSGHTQGVFSVAYSPDGRYLASGGRDHAVIIWDVGTRRHLRTLAGHTETVNSVVFSPDGRLLASGGSDFRFRLWDVAMGRELFNVRDEDDVNGVAFSPDGRLVVSIGASLRIWEVGTRREVRHLTGSEYRGSSVAFSPDGRWLALGTIPVKLLEVGTWRVSSTLEGHTDPVTSVAFSPDGRLLASASYDKTVKLWDVRTSRLVRTLVGHTDAVRSVSFSSDGRRLVSGSHDKSIRIWKTASGQNALTIGPFAEAITSVVFSRDGQQIVAADYSPNIKLLVTDTGRNLPPLSGNALEVKAVAWSVDGRWLATGGTDGKVQLWEIATGREAQRLSGHTGTISALAFSPDGRMLASSSSDRTIRLWDVATWRTRLTLNSNWGFSVAFSPDGHLLASGDFDGVVKLWDLVSGQTVRTFGKPREQGDLTLRIAYGVAFSPNRRWLAVASADYAAPIRLLDLQSGSTSPRVLKGHQNGATCLAFSPDSRTLVSGGIDRTVRVWDVEAGQEMNRMLRHRNTVLTVAFSPDGRAFISGGTDQIFMWDPTTGHELLTLASHTGNVWSAAYSTDGAWLATGSDDGSTRIWSAQTGELKATLVSLRANADWLVITPDGLFDGSSSAWKQILWRFNNNTFDDAPVETFFSDFYYPGLLTDIFSGKLPKAPSDISQKDRRQPRLRLTVADSQINRNPTERNLKVKIDVAELAADKDHKAGSGAQDVRLFRNGSLVRVWRGDVLKGQSNVTLEATIPIVAGENKLTAYAFNHDNIKSSDAELTVTGADTLKRQGTLYVFAVGVGKYANSNYNLDYTPDDATSFAAQLKLQQEKLRHYKSVEISTLLNEQATKQNIIAQLRKPVASVQPEDAVVVYFSGHGKADGDHFYLIPHDLGYSGSRDQLSAEGLKQVLAHSISDVELEEAFRGIDAGQIFMIIDACNSGQALENKDEPRRGPMNTRGLAQLAYEKGMYIMTASQNVEEAFVSERLKHSYLTYALVEEGLKSNVADENHNGEVTLREWFDYASTRVPKLREETLQSKSLDEVTPRVKAARSRKSQTPRVFYRREAEARPLVVANVSTAQ